MASRTSFMKRQKEQQRQAHHREKAEKKVERQREKEARPAAEAGEDPDLAGIVPGPQPPIEY